MVVAGQPFGTLLLGLITGVAFGFVIFKAGASRYEKIVNMLLLRDFGILKFMMMAVIVGSVGIFLTDSVIYIAPTIILRLAIGGLIFGIGFALLGACPGTVLVSWGEGKKDSWYGILGGLVGAAAFAHVYPTMNKLFITPMNYGPMTVQSALNVSYGVGVAILVAVFGGCILIINKLTAPKSDNPSVGSSRQVS